MSNLRYAYLLMVTIDNHNKYYKFEENTNGTFTVSFGRVGATPQKHDYPMTAWDKKYMEKIRKGYVDQTALHDAVVTATDSKYEPISDAAVDDLMVRLQRYANELIKSNYTVKSAEVTQKMCDAAQTLISQLSYAISVDNFNYILMKLFLIIPRRMTDVYSNLASSTKDFEEIVRKEQDLLDVMSGQISTPKPVNSPNVEKKGQTLLDALGIEIRRVTPEEEKEIKKHLSAESEGRFKTAFRIVNKKTEEQFNKWCETNKAGKRNIHMYYHGSRNENWFHIIKQGLKLNPNAKVTGKMFGYGIYFAPRAKKSIGYTSCQGAYWTKGSSTEGFLAVYKVAYKKPLDVQNHQSWMQTLTAKEMVKRGNDALFAHKGTCLINDEVIVYDEAQCTLRYLIILN